MKTYCAVEKRGYPDSDIATVTIHQQGRSLAESTFVIHVLTSTEGHTTDGWEATYTAHRAEDGSWKLSNVHVASEQVILAIDVPNLEDPEENR